MKGGTASIVSFLPRHRCSKICGILRPLPIQIALTCFTDTLTWLLSDMLSECQCHTVSVNVSRLECTHTSNDFSKIKSPGSSHPPAEDDIRGKGLIDCRPLIFFIFFFKQAQMYRFTFAEIWMLLSESKHCSNTWLESGHVNLCASTSTGITARVLKYNSVRR